ncbi:MAG: 16S rRNA (uracil(1498)-N(3))-methyltransferase [Pirellulales bacterium]|nr:16S rRNA (uracil(1498)-N(3))-methyltransferase [Pirellulales bacterium]
MSDRYFVETPISSDRAMLGGAEAHHLIHVMRAKRGSRVVLFDGSGAEFAAAVETIGRSEIELRILSREEIDRELPLRITLGIALPKGDRQKWLVEKAVELGVAALMPLKTARAAAQPVERASDRLRRAVVEASKQCGRNRLMEIRKPQNWAEFIEDSAAEPCRLLAHPQGFHRGADPLPNLKPPQSILLAVGPEGGFTPDETALAVAAGWHTIDLGRRMLRIETAALLLTAMASQWYAGIGRGEGRGERGE